MLYPVLLKNTLPQFKQCPAYVKTNILPYLSEIFSFTKENAVISKAERKKFSIKKKSFFYLGIAYRPFRGYNIDSPAKSY